MVDRRSVLDRAIETLAPKWGASRARARAMIQRSATASRMFEQVRMHYDASTLGRRSNGWRQVSSDANDVMLSSRSRLRDIARDMVRNNALAAKGVSVIAGNVVGRGIIPTVQGKRVPQAVKDRVEELIAEHLETTAIDAAGKLDVYGIQALVMRGVAEGGEMLLRRRPRRPSDGLPLPFQIQVMEPDYIDATINGPQQNGTIAVQGISFSPFGRIEGYWLFDQHPGSSTFFTGNRLVSRMVPAEDIAHVYRVDRAGQVRGMTWFAPVILKLKDLDDFKDAHLMRQKIAACFAAFVTREDSMQFDPGGEGTVTEDPNNPIPLESFEPGMIEHLSPGEDVQFGSPPQVTDFDPYVKAHARDIAAGLGISYESLTGDLSQVNFSSGRMGWLEFQRAIDGWRDYMLIPQACNAIARWFLEAAQIAGTGQQTGLTIKWTAPRREMISPAQEVPAIRMAIRAGLTSRSEEQRKLGFDPIELDNEIATDNQRADDLELVLDSDARKTSNAGLTQARPVGTQLPSTQINEDVPGQPAAAPAQPPANEPNEDEEDDDAA